MRNFQFTATKIIEAQSEEEAKQLFADSSWDFAAEADCVELSDGYRNAPLRTDPNYELYKLVVEDAQSVAEELLGRELADGELCSIEHKIGEYIDWHLAMTLCIRHRVLGET